MANKENDVKTDTSGHAFVLGKGGLCAVCHRAEYAGVVHPVRERSKSEMRRIAIQKEGG